MLYRLSHDLCLPSACVCVFLIPVTSHNARCARRPAVDKLCSTCQKKKPIESFISGETRFPLIHFRALACLKPSSHHRSTCFKVTSSVILSAFDFRLSELRIRETASFAGRATCTKCRGRKREQYNSAKVLNGGPKTKRTKAEDGNTVTHGVGEKKMRMMLQSNSELKAMVASQQGQIQHLTDQLVLSGRHSDSLATKLSEALKVVAQAHSQLMLHGTANNNQWGDSNGVLIPLHPPQPPNNNTFWHQRQEQAAQTSRTTSPGFPLNPAIAGQHSSSISMASGQTVHSHQTAHSEAADSGRHMVQAAAYAIQQPLISQTANPSNVSEDEQLLGWWQGATGYDTANTAAHSMADPTIVNTNEKQRCENSGDCMLLPRQGDSNVQDLSADSTAPSYVQRFLPEPFKQLHMRGTAHKRRGSDRSVDTEIRFDKQARLEPIAVPDPAGKWANLATERHRVNYDVLNS